MSDDPTLPPAVKNDAKVIGNWLMNWSQNHTVATAAILGFLTGWLLPKVVKWFI